MSNSILEHQTYNITKNRQDIHEFLTEQTSIESELTMKLKEYDMEPMKNRKLNLRNDKENPRKIRHIKGMTDLRSVDLRKPKFLRLGYLDDGRDERMN